MQAVVSRHGRRQCPGRNPLRRREPVRQAALHVPQQLADSPAHALNAYPGENGVEHYAEGLLVGYRWFDTKNIEPLFPFGHGLSYTRFAYSDLQTGRRRQSHRTRS